jgi:hypothetical protein
MRRVNVSINGSSKYLFKDQDLMIRTIRRHSIVHRAALALMLIGMPAIAGAASISYPAVGPIPPGLTFTNIVESSGTDGVPLYGSPSPIVVGLAFNPTPAFSATSTNGGADLTDGQLNYTITAGPGSGGIPLINFSEGGLFTLAGIGTPATQVLAGAILRATVFEINGAPVAPINLAPVSASAAFNLVANPGLNQTWGFSLSLDVAAQLAFLGFGPNQLATKADVVIDNALIAISQPGTVAQISKDDFVVTLMPEPASCLMLGMALCGVGFIRRDRSKG